MFPLHVIRGLLWAGFVKFWTLVQIPHALFYIGALVFAWVLLLLVALRLVTWLQDSGAWPAVLMRLLGGLILTGLAASTIAGGGLALAAWGGSYYAANPSRELIVAVFGGVVHAALYGAVTGLVLGFGVVFYLTRVTVPQFVSLLEHGKRKAHQDELTDARTVSGILPEGNTYDPRQYFDACARRGEVFIGLERGKRPVTLAVQRVLGSHAQLLGPTGSGKGVAAQTLLAQAIRRGEAVIVMDPKPGGDKWLPSVLRAECKAAGVPFRFMNLCADIPQFNLLKGAKAREITQLLTTGLRLGRRGGEGDFYRLAERAFAKRGARGEFGPPDSLPALADALREAAGDEAEKLRGLLDQVDELADIPAIQTAGGEDLAAVLEEGGVLYIAGSDMDDEVLLVQPMIVLRLVQLLRCREQNTGRHVTLFLDEVKYLLSTPVINSLGTIRDWGCSLVLAHQALEDLVCIDADRETTEGAVRINCTLRLCYRQTDPATVQWIEAQTGTILVNTESREIARNAALSEVQHETRRVQQVQRPLIDANMIQQLPDGCGVLIGAGPARLVFTAPLTVERRAFIPATAPKLERRQPSDLLRRDETAGSAPREELGL